MTFAEIARIVNRQIGRSAQFDVIQTLREAENDNIERTFCTQTIETVSTEDLNDGTLSDTYELPDDFVEEFRMEWNGVKLGKASIKSPIWAFDSSGEPNTGTPTEYWIENDEIRFILKPSSHGYWGRWYCHKNTSSVIASPIIPSIEHRNLANYAIYIYFEMPGSFDQVKAAYFKNQYLIDCGNAYEKYKEQRGENQSRIIDVVEEVDQVFYPYTFTAPS